ncbi:MAG: hypothetical protein WBA59_11415 [Moheibacter sp.]
MEFEQREKIKVFTVAGACRYLNISQSTFNSIYKPRLELAGKQGRKHLYKVDDVKALHLKIKQEKMVSEKFDIIDDIAIEMSSKARSTKFKR